jgi:PAS domain-containing protein
MNLRNLVDAIRRKPASEASAAPNAAEDPSSPPPVEVADVVAAADTPLAPRTSPIVQSLLGGFATGEHRAQRHSGALPALPPPEMMPPPPMPQMPAPMPPPIPASAPTANPFAEFEAVNRSLSNGEFDTPPRPVPQVQVAEPPPVLPLPPPPPPTPTSIQPPPNSWFDVPLSPNSGEQVPAPESPGFPSFSPETFQPVQPSLPPVAAAPAVAPLPASPQSPPPVLIPAPLVPPAPMPAPMAEASVPESFPLFVSHLGQATTPGDVLRGLAQAALDCLGASRTFLVPISTDGQPGSVEAGFGDGAGPLRGLVLSSEFVNRLISHANLFSDPSLIEMSPGLSLLPPEHFAPAEAYLVLGPPPWPTVIGVQWNAPPSDTTRTWAKTLVQCTRLAFQRLTAAQAPISLPATPSQAMPAPLAIATRAGMLAEAIFNKLNEALILLDQDGIIHAVNPMAEYALNCLSPDAVGRRLYDVGRKYGTTNVELWEHLATSDEEQQFAAELHFADGHVMTTTIVVVEVPAQAPAWSGGRAIAIRDVSHVRAEITASFEESLRHHEEAARATASALLVSEEELARMRNSLQMVLGFSELLHRGEYGAMNPQQFEMFRNIEHHAKEMAGLLGLASE